MSKTIEDFDPSGVGVNNGNFIGLPFSEAEARVVLQPVPWEVTTSYRTGTATGAENIRAASVQLDLLDVDVPDAWKIGIFMRPSDADILAQSNELRSEVSRYIDLLENEALEAANFDTAGFLKKIDAASAALNDWVYRQTKGLLDADKLVGLVGGDHSTPYGFLRALAERHGAFGILQIDAHADLRQAYEGFEHSHASIFYNVLKMPEVTTLVQAGIRDFCEEEQALMNAEKGRVQVFFDAAIKQQLFEGTSFKRVCEEIIAPLPQKVYVSFDIDGLDPTLCPNTGTPVPSGFQFAEVIFLLNLLVQSGRTIIGFDLSEVNGQHEWDGNVGARILYKLANLMAKSNFRR